jgi:nitrogen fixation protein FixH
MTSTADGRPRRGRARAGPRGWFWPALVGALLIGGVGANVGLMVAATRDPSFAVERDYYRKALHWDETMAQEATNAALGWSVAVAVEPAEVPGRARIRARVADREGRPVTGARVAVEAFPSARASHVLSLVLPPDAGGGYAATLELERPGLWELRFRVERDGQVFTRTLVRDLG